MSTDDFQGDKPHDDERTEETTECGCTEELACFEHYEPNVDHDGGLSRVPHTPMLGDRYVMDDTIVEVAIFTDGGRTVVFETVNGPLREYALPVGVVKTTDIVTYLR